MNERLAELESQRREIDVEIVQERRSEAGRRLKAHFRRLIEAEDAAVGETFDDILRMWGRTERGAMALASALDRREE